MAVLFVPAGVPASFTRKELMTKSLTELILLGGLPVELS